MKNSKNFSFKSLSFSILFLFSREMGKLRTGKEVRIQNLNLDCKDSIRLGIFQVP